MYAKNRLLGIPNTVAAARCAFDQRCTAMTFTLSGFGVSSGSDHRGRPSASSAIGRMSAR
ncbi:MAG: hypothetical protein IMZ69_08830 [Spirochaetes bacterium]|nr:hypothetical protein [Spirochaetota bacterium]